MERTIGILEGDQILVFIFVFALSYCVIKSSVAAEVGNTWWISILL